MKITQINIPISDLVNEYRNDEENGAFGFFGKLNIRPQYQREFVYKDSQKKSVIETINKNLPLNVMYWSKNDENSFELLDGQQRTLSICDYVNNGFSLDEMYFENLTKDEQNKILSYNLMIYVCEGTVREKLDWFKIINISGEKLTEQELRNAVYCGAWLNDAKKTFSKTKGWVYEKYSKYLKGIPIRQEYLETVLSWISNNNIEDYMGKNQHSENANELIEYFKNVMIWVEKIFVVYRKEMLGLDFGYLYEKYKNLEFNPEIIEDKIKNLMIDDEVTNKKGIYEYVLSNNENLLNIRKFSEKDKRQKYEMQNKICVVCNKIYEYSEMEADHIIPWSKGGKTDLNNCQLLCKQDNRKKSDK